MRRKIDGQTAFIYARKQLSLMVSRLRNKGGFLPGERSLCEEIGVSRGTLKTAIESLVRIGEIEILPRKGNYVRKVHPLKFRAGLITALGEMPYLGGYTALVAAGAIETIALDESVGLHELQISEVAEAATFADQYALDGILWLDPRAECFEEFEKLLDSPFPVVAAVATFEAPKLSGNYVNIDIAGNEAAKLKHLLDLGCRKIALLGETGSGKKAMMSALEKAGLAVEESLFLYGLEETKERLPAMIEKDGVDGIVQNGGGERMDALFSILDAMPESRRPKVLADYIPQFKPRFANRAASWLHLNIMPSKEIGKAAAEMLLAAKGRRNWHCEPKLLMPKIIPSEKMFREEEES